MSAEDISIKEITEKAPKIKRESKKKRITNYIKKCSKDDINDVYVDIIDENEKLRKELEKERQLRSAIQNEYDEMRNGLLHDRFMMCLEHNWLIFDLFYSLVYGRRDRSR